LNEFSLPVKRLAAQMVAAKGNVAIQKTMFIVELLFLSTVSPRNWKDTAY